MLLSMSYAFRRPALAAVMLVALGCATPKGQGGESIEWKTGRKTGNPFEIRLTASGPELKAILVNLSSSEQWMLHNSNLEPSTIELVPPFGSRPKPYDSRLIKKPDNTPYCQLFLKLAPGQKLVLDSVRFRATRDGFAGQWGPFNFDEVPAGEYQARVAWHNERTQCLDESTRRMRNLPSVWKGMVKSNVVTLRLP